MVDTFDEALIQIATHLPHIVALEEFQFEISKTARWCEQNTGQRVYIYRTRAGYDLSPETGAWACARIEERVFFYFRDYQPAVEFKLLFG